LIGTEFYVFEALSLCDCKHKRRQRNPLLTFDGEPAGDGIPDFAGDVTGVFLGDPLGEVVEGSSSLPRREGGGRSVHEGALGPPKAPYAINP